jgi:hypothetical protein
MPPAQPHFGETRWSLVLAAQGGDDPQPALAELCGI